MTILARILSIVVIMVLASILWGYVVDSVTKKQLSLISGIMFGFGLGYFICPKIDKWLINGRQ